MGRTARRAFLGSLAALAAMAGCSAGDRSARAGDDAAAVAVLEDGPRPPKPGDLVVYLTGDPADAPNKATGGPALLVMGGGREDRDSFTERAYPIINGGDIVIIRASGSDGYNDFLYNLMEGPLKPNSIETIMLDTPEKANSDYVVWALRTAEMIWMAGGSQSRYVDAWKGTRAEDAIRETYLAGAVLGGTSAGLAVVGEFVYAPAGSGSATSAPSILDPFNDRITIASDFLDLPMMRGYITDSHFRNRDRMGRSLAFMARIRAAGHPGPIRNIAISERTALFIDRDGLGTVYGPQEVYILAEDAETRLEQVEPGKPLVYKDILRTKLLAGDTYHVLTGEASQPAIRLTADGNGEPPHITPQNYYD